MQRAPPEEHCFATAICIKRHPPPPRAIFGSLIPSPPDPSPPIPNHRPDPPTPDPRLQTPSSPTLGSHTTDPISPYPNSQTPARNFRDPDPKPQLPDHRSQTTDQTFYPKSQNPRSQTSGSQIPPRSQPPDPRPLLSDPNSRTLDSKWVCVHMNCVHMRCYACAETGRPPRAARPHGPRPRHGTPPQRRYMLGCAYAS